VAGATGLQKVSGLKYLPESANVFRPPFHGHNHSDVRTRHGPPQGPTGAFRAAQAPNAPARANGRTTGRPVAERGGPLNLDIFELPKRRLPTATCPRYSCGGCQNPEDCLGEFGSPYPSRRRGARSERAHATDASWRVRLLAKFGRGRAPCPGLTAKNVRRVAISRSEPPAFRHGAHRDAQRHPRR
jgi:hypothetical protein